MNADTVESEEVLRPLLIPVVEFMISHQMEALHIKASVSVVLGSETGFFSDDVSVVYCSAEPGPGLQGIYIVMDDKGEGRIDGPPVIPQPVLRPLLKALTELKVVQLDIETVSEALEGTAAALPLALAPLFNVDEFDEDVIPSPHPVYSVTSVWSEWD